MSRAAQESPTKPTNTVMMARLRRVEGQVRGLQHMVETDAACVDVLTQISATARALDGAALLLLTEHLRSCVAAGGGREALEERSREVSDAVAGLIGA
jgi:DNA-binding FrmR family transcriptional regulator